MFCQNCGGEIPEQASFCPNCGRASRRAPDEASSPKSWMVTLLLCLFLGGLSAHRFYAGKIWTAVLQIVTLGGLGVWLIYDLIMIICQKFKDGNGLVIRDSP